MGVFTQTNARTQTNRPPSLPCILWLVNTIHSVNWNWLNLKSYDLILCDCLCRWQDLFPSIGPRSFLLWLLFVLIDLMFIFTWTLLWWLELNFSLRFVFLFDMKQYRYRQTTFPLLWIIKIFNRNFGIYFVFIFVSVQESMRALTWCYVCLCIRA